MGIHLCALGTCARDKLGSGFTITDSTKWNGALIVVDKSMLTLVDCYGLSKSFVS